MSDGKIRLIGLFSMMLFFGFLYISFIEPLSQAQVGVESIRDSRKVVTLLPLTAIVAICFMVGGRSFFEAITHSNGTKFTRLGYVVVAIGALLGFAMTYWYSDMLSTLGYVRRLAF